MIKLQNLKSSPFEVVFKAEEQETKESIEFNLVHSTHSRVRASQRGLSNEKITATLTYGKMVCKQGMEYYILTSKDIPAHLEHMKKELENTVVLLSATGCLITCYRRNNPFRHIYKKSKTLY